MSYLILPTGYGTTIPFGTSLNASATFSNKTLTGLGYTPGSYSWTLGADTFQVSAGSLAPVPEPSSSLALLALGAGGLLMRRRL